MNWQEFQNWHGEVLEEGAEIAKAIGLLLLMLFIGLPLMILFSPIWLPAYLISLLCGRVGKYQSRSFKSSTEILQKC